MDLKVHKVILYYAMKNSCASQKIDEDFLAIWAGNWITDINQASCVLDLLPDKAIKGFFKNDKKFENYTEMKKKQSCVNNVFESDDSVQYILTPLIKAIEKNWTNLIKELWNAEVESTKDEPDLKNANAKNVIHFDIQKIGMYCPLDHFDVVSIKDEEELTGKTDMFTKTAYNGIFKHAYNRLLKKAFELRDTDRSTSLFYLGRALHVLADFYAHSNFVYLILRYFAEENDTYNAIDNYFDVSWEHLLFQKFGEMDQIPVLTARFDKIDTFASVLKIYKNFLIPDFNDFKEEIISFNADHSEIVDSDPEKNETILVLNILFGTFSNFKFIQQFKGITIFTVKVLDFLKRLKGKIKNKFLDIIDDVIEKELKSTDYEHLVDLAKELNTYAPNDPEANLQNHLKAGKLMYYNHMIQKTLIRNLVEHKKEYLPHHTLIANDSDNIHPVRRLEYKLACYFAHQVNNEIIEIYYQNGSINDVKNILDKYYVYPRKYYDAKKTDICKAIGEMYGCRWWEYIREDQGKKKCLE